jgi:GNAT superfamily N-acetyltransferase
MIRAMEITDIPRVAEIHVFGWRSAYRGIASDSLLFNKMTVERRMEAFRSFVENEAAENYVYDDGIIKAFMTAGQCRDADKPDSFELWGVYVEPFMQREGIGSKMVGFCEARARERGFGEVCLWVLEKNEAARAFYEKMGYGADGKAIYLDSLDAFEVRYTKLLNPL